MLEGTGFLYAHCFFKICEIFVSCMCHYKWSNFFSLAENPSTFSIFILLFKTGFMLGFEYCLALWIMVTIWPNLEELELLEEKSRAARYPAFESGSQQYLVCTYGIKNWFFFLPKQIKHVRIKTPWTLFLSLFFIQLIPVCARFHMVKEKNFF